MTTLPLQGETPALFHFGGFTLDMQRRGLYRDGKRIHLTSKPLELLIYLIENRGRPIEKRELLDAVWNGVFVTEDNLVQAIMEIRRALRDNKDDPRFIQTVPRRGYRFLAEVSLGWPPVELPVTSATPPVVHESGTPPSYRSLSVIKGNPRGAALGASALLMLLFGASLGFYVLFLRDRPQPKSQMPFQKVKFARVTTNGKVTSAALSPDGKYVIYALNSEGMESLWLTHVATASQIQITKPTEVSHRALTFSPDSVFFYYVVRDDKELGELYQMPLLGGPAKKLISDVDSAITSSPDGKHISFIRGYPEKREFTLVIANADGTGQQEIATRKRPDFLPTLFNGAPAWSPAGEVIACPAGSSDATGRYMTVVEVPASGGAIRPITSQRWWQVGQLAWLGDGSGLIMVAKQQASDPSQIWHLSYSTGEARLVTNDLNNYVGVSLTRDNPPAVVTVQSNVLSSISIAPDDTNAKHIPISSIDGVVGISWTPEGRIVYASRQRDNQNIYIMDQDGSNQKQLTTGRLDNKWPSVSPDGRYIVFMSNRTGANNIWRIDIDGGNPKQLTSGSDARWPRCAPNSHWVVYASIGNPAGLYKVSIDGGDSVRLTDKAPTAPSISPDGKLIASGYFEDPEANRTAVYSFDGGAPVKILSFFSLMCWTPNGRNLTYIDRHGAPNIVSQSIEGGQPRQITYFKDGEVVGFDWSLDGKLACSRKVVTADAVMINDLF